MSDLADVDFLCIWGLKLELYAELVFWLDESRLRRIVFILETAEEIASLNKNADAFLLLNDCRVKIYPFESPLLLESLAKKIAWQAVFLKMKIMEVQLGSSYFEAFSKQLHHYHLGADLILSDAADCGFSLFQNIRSRIRGPTRSALHLKNVFSSIPAVIVGAGPSLEKNRALLKSISEKGLILAGGTALNVLDFPPHFGASIDAHAPYSQFKQQRFSEVPFCFQSRMNADNFSLIHGEALLAPDSHFSYINWLDGEEESFDGGWTVGNFLTALAVHWGCNPIVFVGMDFCYHLDQKYVDFEPEKGEKLHFVEGVWTQRDWLMARQWTQELAKKREDRTFINATEGGMGLSLPIETKKLKEIDFGSKKGVSSLVHQAIHSLPHLSSSSVRWDIWKKSLENCAHICKKMLSSFEDIALDLHLEEEIVYEKFLSPLWNVWRPIFERELDLDPHQGIADKLKLNQFLFFQQAIEEQLHVLK